MVLLLVLTAGAFLFAWRKLKVGAPKPQMAIDEAKKIRATRPRGAAADGDAHPRGDPRLDRANRQELGTAVEQLRAEVVKLTDWRAQLRHTSRRC